MMADDAGGKAAVYTTETTTFSVFLRKSQNLSPAHTHSLSLCGQSHYL